MKEYIIIDDNDQTSIIELVDDKVKSGGLESHGYWFDPNQSSCLKKIGEGDTTEFIIDKDKVIARLDELFKGKSVNFIFADYKLDDQNTDGLQLVRYLKSNWRNGKVPVVMYSSDLDLIISKLESEWNKFSNFRTQYHEIQKYFSEYPDDTISRTDYQDKLIEYIKKVRLNLDNLLVSKLEEYGSEEFKNIYPRFKGKKLHEIASLISMNTAVSDDFRLELIERSISHFIDLKE